MMENVATLREKYRLLINSLDERGRRRWAASEALAIGRGGRRQVHLATGIARSTIDRGIKEIESDADLEPGRSRRHGGGRKAIALREPNLLEILETIMEPVTRGDPQSSLLWTCRSTRDIAAELVRHGVRIGARSVGYLLKKQGFSLQSNRKTREGKDHPDRNEQFMHISARANRFMATNDPVISVDTKKKELVGNYKNGGRAWRKKNAPCEVNTHDFPDPSVAKAIPYGIYDLAANLGWVSVGITHDTAEFAVRSISAWWYGMGKALYPEAKRILITADGGGSNGYRNRLWKLCLQEFADKSGLDVHVSHFPPGTSKWNKIEHRLFSFITKRWAGQPLKDHATIVSLIGSTRTKSGLKVRARLDKRNYEAGRKISDEDMMSIQLKSSRFHGEWNYTIRAHRK